jgi:hypothetical protein
LLRQLLRESHIRQCSLALLQLQDILLNRFL